MWLSVERIVIMLPQKQHPGRNGIAQNEIPKSEATYYLEGLRSGKGPWLSDGSTTMTMIKDEKWHDRPVEAAS